MSGTIRGAGCARRNFSPDLESLYYVENTPVDTVDRLGCHWPGGARKQPAYWLSRFYQAIEEFLAAWNEKPNRRRV